MTKILLLVLSYGIGSISGSFLLGRWVLGIDVRHAGSGNAGTTNAMRVLGRKLGALTFLIDWLKGILAMLLVHWIAPEFSVPCALFCVLGHDFPFYMRWKGGKGVATTFGCFLIINPFAALIAGFFWLVSMLVSRYVSLGSLVLFTVLAFVYRGPYMPLVWAIALLGYFQHRSNILRLLKGTERRIGKKEVES